MTSVALPNGRVNAAAIEWIGYQEGLGDDFHIVVRSASHDYFHSTAQTLADAEMAVARLCVEAGIASLDIEIVHGGPGTPSILFATCGDPYASNKELRGCGTTLRKTGDAGWVHLASGENRGWCNWPNPIDERSQEEEEFAEVLRGYGGGADALDAARDL